MVYFVYYVDRTHKRATWRWPKRLELFSWFFCFRPSQRIGESTSGQAGKLKRTVEESSAAKGEIKRKTQHQPTPQGRLENNPLDMNPNEVEKTWEELVEQNLVTQKAGIKPFCCNQCNYQSLLKGHVTTHVRSRHYKIRDYKCSKCPQEFSWPSNLRVHVLSQHPEGSEESQGTARTNPPTNSSDHQNVGSNWGQ